MWSSDADQPGLSGGLIIGRLGNLSLHPLQEPRFMILLVVSQDYARGARALRLTEISLRPDSEPDYESEAR